MRKLSTRQKNISYLFQTLSALILAKASYEKFTSSEMSVSIFRELGMDETRLIIATIVGIAALLLVTKKTPQYGAILGFGTMIGALIAHVTVLGLEVNNDGGMMVFLMGTVIISTSIVMWIRRKCIPMIGHTCE